MTPKYERYSSFALQGFERAVKARADSIAIFAAASEAFSQRNINCSIAESLMRFEPVARSALEKAMPVRACALQKL
jgi:hydroxymethylglutaryl-CoA lyase